MYEIVDDIPMPATKTSVKTQALPFANLIKKGQSFFVPSTDRINVTVKVAANRYMASHPDVKLCVFKEPDGSRVFRD